MINENSKADQQTGETKKTNRIARSNAFRVFGFLPVD